MSTLRKVADVVTLYPAFVEARRQSVDLLDIELNVIRNIRWELAKLHDEAAVVRCMSFIMDHLGFERRTPTDDDEM
jgi:hypothetical protein